MTDDQNLPLVPDPEPAHLEKVNDDLDVTGLGFAETGVPWSNQQPVDPGIDPAVPQDPNWSPK